MFYSWSCKNIDDFKKRIDEMCAEYDKYADHATWQSWRRPRPDVQIWEYDLIENLINLEQKYKRKKEFTVRRENQNFTVYTSNTSIIKEILSFYPQADISKVDLMPTGVLVFKREPPAKYRAYFTNNKVPPSFKEDFLEYLGRTPDIVPSTALYTYLHRQNKYNYHHYLWDKYYVDYNDDKNLMMLMLIFPDAIGKRYKLEKK